MCYKTSTMKKIFILLFTFSAMAAETDQFSRRDEFLPDSSEIINLKANLNVKSSLDELNKKNIGCDEKLLYQELRKYFGNHSNGLLTKEIIASDEIPKRKLEMLNSVFKDWSPWDGLGMGLWFMKKSDLTLTSVVRVGEATIGTDKFEHFFGQGFSYFTNNYLEKKGPIKALKIGITKEKIFLGGNKFGNGVFSFGDLSANFNGMRFWNHILLKNDDVLGKDKNLGPYIVCKDNQWAQNIEIDFRDYIDLSMDESINCSKFPSKSTVRKMQKNVAELGLKCPVDQDSFNQMATKYGDYSKWILNFDGFDTIDYFGEFQE